MYACICIRLYVRDSRDYAIVYTLYVYVYAVTSAPTRLRLSSRAKYTLLR